MDEIINEINTRTNGDNVSVGKLVFSCVDDVLSLMDANDLIEIEPCAKAIIGIVVEKRFLKAYKFPKTENLDTEISGTQLDVKTTIGSNWMIPPEATNHWCLLFQIDCPRKRFSYGLLKMSEDNLTKGGNRDKKKSVNKIGKSRIRWIAKDVEVV